MEPIHTIRTANGLLLAVSAVPAGKDPVELGWWHAALCREVDVNVFFPLPTDRATVELALALCRRCPVRRQCLRHAMTRPERYGIWGGMTEREREAALRGARTSGCATRTADVSPGKSHD